MKKSNPLQVYLVENKVPLHRLSTQLGLSYPTLRRFAEIEPGRTLLGMKIGNVLLIEQHTGIDFMPYLRELYAAVPPKTLPRA